MKTTKNITLSDLAKAACETFNKLTHATTDEEFELNYANLEKIIKMKENMLK